MAGKPTSKKYAILSHRWGAEVSHGEMTGLTKMEERRRDEVSQHAGYQRIIVSCKYGTLAGIGNI